MTRTDRLIIEEMKHFVLTAYSSLANMHIDQARHYARKARWIFEQHKFTDIQQMEQSAGILVNLDINIDHVEHAKLSITQGGTD